MLPIIIVIIIVYSIDVIYRIKWVNAEIFSLGHSW